MRLHKVTSSWFINIIVIPHLSCPRKLTVFETTRSYAVNEPSESIYEPHALYFKTHSNHILLSKPSSRSYLQVLQRIFYNKTCTHVGAGGGAQRRP
jgi:hypothetical protein